MLIAGLASGADSAAALVEVRDGHADVLAVVYQQSIDRVRHSAAFPSAALDACLDVAGRKPSDLDRIVVTNLSAIPARWAPPAAAGGRLAALLRRTGVYRLVHDRAAGRIEAWARGAGFRAVVETVETDLAHAHLAYRTQRHDPVLIAISGPSRDGTRTSLFEARNGQVDPLPLPANATSLAALVEEARLLGLPLTLGGRDATSAPELRERDQIAPLLDNAGAALGAALWEAGAPPHALHDLLLGPGFTSDQAYKALANTQQPRDREDLPSVITAAANALEAGKSVAWARGRAGANPDLLPTRALLSRTIGVPLLVADEPALATLLLRTGPLCMQPLTRPGQPAALSPTDVIRVFRAACATGGRTAPGLLVLGDYLVHPAG